MDNSTESGRESTAEKIRPANCMYCGSEHMQLEGWHFPRFFFSCKTCEKRTELVYNWITGQATLG